MSLEQQGRTRTQVRRVKIGILTDCDPHGFSIAKVYIYSAQKSKMSPDLQGTALRGRAQWVGLSLNQCET